MLEGRDVNIKFHSVFYVIHNSLEGRHVTITFQDIRQLCIVSVA